MIAKGIGVAKVVLSDSWWQCSVTVLEFKSDRIMTKQFYRKYGQVLNLTLLILWTILTPSHFQKGGVVQEFYIAIAVFVTAVSFIITLPVDNLHWQERISISILFAFVSLFITTLIIGPKIVDIIYSDKTWNLWETKHRIFMNSVFYGLNTIILSMLYFIYFKAKAQSKNRKKLKRTIT